MRRRTSLLAGTAALLSVLGSPLLGTATAGAVSSGTSPAAGAGVAAHGDLTSLRASFDPQGTPKRQTRARGSASATAVGAPDTADIAVVYQGNWDGAARNAFQAAVDVWRKRVVARVPITINAEWTPLDTSVLGQAGPTNFRRDFAGAPRRATYYPDALANSLAGRDLDPSSPEIEARFNSAFPYWYKGTDGQPGWDTYDLESVVLHELTHGLGFVGTLDGQTPPSWTDDGRGFWGLDAPGDAPAVFDELLTDGQNRGALDTTTYPNGGLALGSLLRGANGGLRWSGSAATGANAGAAPRLYTPARFEEGSSVSHLDEATYPAGSPNALMTPYLSNNEVAHDPGPIVTGMLADMGWGGVASTTSAAIAARYAALGGPTGVLGPQTSMEFTTRSGQGHYVIYRYGRIYYSPLTGARAVLGSIDMKWLSLQAESGLLRYPTNDELAVGDGVGRYSTFQGGSVFWSPATGADEVHGTISTAWLAAGGARGVLGYPVTDERGTPDRIGRYNHFQAGSVYWTPTTGAHEVYGAIRYRWAALGWERGRLGYPTSGEFSVTGGRRNLFQHGSITWVARTNSVVVAYY